MPSTDFSAELTRHGPDAPAIDRYTLAEAQVYCGSLARQHYENFTVASWLLPRELRPHFHSIYAYCRWADDLADETGGGQRSLELLDWWQSQLKSCYDDQPQHPVFVALRETILQFEIPQQPFSDLLEAFRRDQRQTRYETFDELLDYCRCSANPVGRLVLYLGRCCDEANAQLSDSVCTGLQLANFWQDVARDWQIGRVYLPAESLRRAGYDEAMFERREANDAFRHMLAAEVDRAEEFLRAGRPLIQQVPRSLRLDVALFIAGGLAVLDAIRRVDYDVWSVRPTVSRAGKLKLLLRSWWTLKK
jgi:squalene synthase HpnC